jgi:hypothetical protein
MQENGAQQYLSHRCSTLTISLPSLHAELKAACLIETARLIHLFEARVVFDQAQM